MDEDVKILCVDDEKNVLRSLERLFMDDDYEIITAVSGEDGLRVMEGEVDVQVVISDYRMPGMNGVDFLKQVCESWPETIRIVLSGYADTASVVGAINEGQIYKFIPKPWNDDELKVTIDKAIESYFLHKRNNELTEKLRESNEELQLLNANLEKIVEERTAELLFQNEVLTRSQHILDSLPVGVLGIDDTGCIVKHNQLCKELLFPEGMPSFGEEAGKVLTPELLDFVESVTKKKEHSSTLLVNGREVNVKGRTMDKDKCRNCIVVALIVDN